MIIDFEECPTDRMVNVINAIPTALSRNARLEGLLSHPNVLHRRPAPAR
jgi:hypothetical protein